MSKTISVRIDDSMHDLVKDEANNEGITVNEKLKGMLNQHFNEDKQEAVKTENENETIVKALKIVDESNQALEIRLKDMAENQKKILEEIDFRIKNHETKYKHEIDCINGLRCNSN